MAAPGRPALLSPSFLVVSASAVFYFTALGTTLPTLPRLVRDELGGGGVAIGIAAGALAVTAAALRPWVGRVGDSGGRRKLVVLGALTLGASLLGYAAAGSIPVLVVARLLTGVAEAMYFVGCATAVQDMAPDSRRAEAASYFSLAVWGGTGLGPVIAEWVREAHGFDAVWYVAVGLCAISALLGRWTPTGDRVPIQPGRRRFHQSAIRPGNVLLTNVIGLAAFQTFAALYADDLDISAGPVFAMYSVLLVGSRLFGASIPDRLGPRRVAATGLVVETIGLVVMAAWASPAGLYLGAGLLALGIAPVYPALLRLVVDEAPDTERTSAVATFSLFFDIGTGLGLPVLGVIAAGGGEQAAFAAGAALSLVGLIVVRYAIPEPRRHVSDPLPILDERDV